MLQKIGLVIRTIINLKPIQVFKQLLLRFKRHRPLSAFEDKSNFSREKLSLIKYPVINTATEYNTFTFLNLPESFQGDIDWNFIGHGKLWNYNLQYMGYINDSDLSLELRVLWIDDLYHQLSLGSVKLEPYPASLRIMNMVRFVSENNLSEKVEQRFNNYLRSELKYLDNNYEFHILGNHLLENAFAMLMGGYYFKETIWIDRATKILKAQLKEQIMLDGAHFELSPMYHQIIFFRLLEAFSYLSDKCDFKSFLKIKLEAMLGWLKQMTFLNGDIPHFNDSAVGITFTSNQLFEFAEQLGIKSTGNPLTDSGYRKFTNNTYEVIMDVHGISPKYQPGHAHADHGSFVLYNIGLPIIVDPGISTYNISPRRQWERSSLAHNTITIDDQNQSEVWSGFRVGRKASVDITEESKYKIDFKIVYKLGDLTINHNRLFQSLEDEILIQDHVNSATLACARFYMAPGINPIRRNEYVDLGSVKLFFENEEKIEFSDYNFAKEFNLLTPAKVIEVYFRKNLLSKMKFNG